MNKDQRIFIAGHKGMVGSAILRLLDAEKFSNLITADRSQLDLTSQIQVQDFFLKHTPDLVIIAAAKVGGISANMKEPADFLFTNLAIQNNLFQASLSIGVKKIIYLGSSCIYPASCPQPMREEYLLTGPLEPTNEGYAIAKIAGLKMAQFFHQQYKMETVSFMPCNLYGTNDHFDLTRSHVLSALVRRFVDAVDDGISEVTLWGTGVARREFMHVDDLARAVLQLESKLDSGSFINVGVGEDISILDLAHLIAKETHYQGEILWDATKPNGMLQKLMDVSKMKSLGFLPAISLQQGIEQMIRDYRGLKNTGKI